MEISRLRNLRADLGGKEAIAKPHIIYEINARLFLYFMRGLYLVWKSTFVFTILVLKSFYQSQRNQTLLLIGAGF